ncbi:hypothetical protein NDU88_000458 [Pleurodeles waltl]|uniref:Uncharacterized protein n=1 Tax=Pleurodeles waltl TaxID=8319 RepID=A0AAV7KQR6_PLEWA|nr:hypothetical protein NDU88_000458 [Pleurodeles waltl]
MKWWATLTNLSNGHTFLHQVPSYIVTTDASLEGWGAHCQDLQISGSWNAKEVQLHISYLELKAIDLALKAFLLKLQNSSVLIRTDNTTSMFYLNKQGGTRSLQLSQLAQDIWTWAIKHNISLKAEHVPGQTNVLADTLSRTVIPYHEWELDQKLLNRLFLLWGKPNLDLFATLENKKCQYYASWLPQKGSWGNAFLMRWSGVYAYAFPPIPLIPRDINKMKTEGCRLLFMAPRWPRQVWYTELLMLSEQPHVQLKQSPTLLTMHQEQVRHPDPSSLHLSALLLNSMSM